MFCLINSDGNAEFHQIVDFLTASPIHYALTQIHATVDGKTVVISKSSVRSDLHFNDEDVTTVASQPQKTHTPRRVKRGRDTEIPQSSGLPKRAGDEAVYTGEDDRVVRAATTATSLKAEQESGNIHKTRSTTTLNEPSPQGTSSGSGPRCHDTTLGDADAQTRFETASKKSHDPPLSEVNTFGNGEDSMEHQADLTDFVPPTPHDSPLSGGQPGSDEGRPNINELMVICTQLSNRVLALEHSKTAQDLVIKNLQKKVKRLEKALRARTPGMKLFKIGDADAQTRFETASKKSHDPPLSEVNIFGNGEDNMEHQADLTDFVPPTPQDSPLSGGQPGSDEGRPNINELMAICTQLSNRVLALEHSKTAQDLVIKNLQKKVKRLEKALRARTPGMKLFKIGTSRRKSLDKENVSKQGRNLKTRSMFEEDDFDDDFKYNVEGDTVNAGGAVNTATTGVSAASASVTTAGVSISTAEPRTPLTTTTTAFEDEDLTIVQTLVKMRSEKAKEKGVAFRDVEESARLTTILPTIDPKDKGKGIMQEPEKPPKNPRKAQIQMDEELAMRLHEEEMDELERRQREIVAVEEASKAVVNQELDDIQAMIEADAQMAARLQSEEQEQFTIE
ncbi:hypothetical protein Tco_0367770 [Tanacetum coccineum]